MEPEQFPAHAFDDLFVWKTVRCTLANQAHFTLHALRLGASLHNLHLLYLTGRFGQENIHNFFQMSGDKNCVSVHWIEMYLQQLQLQQQEPM